MASRGTDEHPDIEHLVERHAGMRRLDRLEWLFGWLRLFYPRAKGLGVSFLLYYFLPQKLLRINGRVPWPVHFTSRVLYCANIQVGKRCAPGMNANCYVQGRNGIVLGNNFRMGPGSGLISANHDLNDYDRWIEAPALRIGDNVWLGMNAVVLPGVSIGDNVVIGANSVVTQDVPGDSIAAGNPCRVVREKGPYQGLDYGTA